MKYLTPFLQPFSELYYLTPPENMGLFLVEPLVAFYAFASFLVYPLVQQYVYRRLWQELTNTTYPVSDDTSRCSTNVSNHSSHNEVCHKPWIGYLFCGSLIKGANSRK